MGGGLGRRGEAGEVIAVAARRGCLEFVAIDREEDVQGGRVVVSCQLSICELVMQGRDSPVGASPRR